jgi:hypothetical protein
MSNEPHLIAEDGTDLGHYTTVEHPNYSVFLESDEEGGLSVRVYSKDLQGKTEFERPLSEIAFPGQTLKQRLVAELRSVTEHLDCVVDAGLQDLSDEGNLSCGYWSDKQAIVKRAKGLLTELVGDEP